MFQYTTTPLMSGPFESDWKPVVWEKPKKPIARPAFVPSAAHAHGTASVAVASMNKEDAPMHHRVTATLSDGLTIQRARLDKRLTQQQLASALSVSLRIIRDIESMKAFPSTDLRLRLNKFLGISLSKKKPVLAVDE